MARAGINPATAGLVGAALGAVAGVVLSDKKTRRKATVALENIRERGEETLHDLRGEMRDLRRQTKRQIADTKRDIHKSGKK